MRKSTLFTLSLLCCGTTLMAVPVQAENSIAHQVKKGETLWGISGTYLNDPLLWPKIWQINPGIENPHRIAPGQHVRIPDIAAQPATEAPAESAAPAFVKPDHAPQPLLAQEVDLSRPPLALLVVREEAPVAEPLSTVSKLSEVLRFDRGIGQVTGELPGDGMILHTPSGWSSEAVAGTIFMRAAGATVGTRYGVYRDLGKVKHPGGWFKSGLGHLLADVGIVEVVGVEGGQQLARVVKAFTEVQEGDLLGPLPILPEIVPVRAYRQPIVATVVAVEFQRLLAAPQDIVYLDAGAGQGLATGDKLAVAGKLGAGGKRQAAALVVLAVTPATAAALVMPESEHHVSIGDQAGPMQ